MSEIGLMASLGKTQLTPPTFHKDPQKRQKNKKTQHPKKPNLGKHSTLTTTFTHMNNKLYTQ